MPILWSQQQKLAGAAQALTEWEQRASAVGVRVTQVNLTLLSEDGVEIPSSSVVFEWNREAGEYQMRTVG